MAGCSTPDVIMGGSVTGCPEGGRARGSEAYCAEEKEWVCARGLVAPICSDSPGEEIGGAPEAWSCSGCANPSFPTTGEEAGVSAPYSLCSLRVRREPAASMILVLFMLFIERTFGIVMTYNSPRSKVRSNMNFYIDPYSMTSGSIQYSNEAKCHSSAATKNEIMKRK